ASSDEQVAPDEESPERIEPPDAAVSFRLDVRSNNRSIARHLERHMELQRFAEFDDLQANELRRLLGAAEDNARDLLAAQGYFDPAIQLSMQEPEKPGEPRRIVMNVDTGRKARVEQVAIEFAEPADSDPASADQRRDIRRDWLLKRGEDFTQQAWDTSRTEG